MGPDAPAETEILVGAAPDAADFDRAASTLRAVIVPFAGLPPALAALLRDREKSGARPLTVHSLHHNHALAAEMAVALLLSASKLLVPADRLLRRCWSLSRSSARALRRSPRAPKRAAMQHTPPQPTPPRTRLRRGQA